LQVNISIDDVSPHPRSSTKCLKCCFEIIKHFDQAKFTLFVPTAYMRVGEQSHDIRNYPEFIKEIKSLPENFEIGYHGHLHALPPYNKGEFFGMDYETCVEKMKTSKAIFEECGIEVKPIFRPPGFGLSPPGFAACRDFGIRVLCLYPGPHYRVFHQGEEDKFDRVVYVDAHPPAEKLVKKDRLSIMYHACEWDKNHLTSGKKDELIGFLDKSTKFLFVQDFYNG
jgi:hypothetical protein